MKKKHPFYKPFNKEVSHAHVKRLGEAQYSYNSEEIIRTNGVPHHKKGKHFSKEECILIIKNNEDVRAFREEVTFWCKTVFGKSNFLKRKMEDILENPSLGEKLSRDIIKNPRSVHRLAGYNFCGFKTKARIKAERSVVWLCGAIDAYTYVVKQLKERLAPNLAAEEKHLGANVGEIIPYRQKTQERQQHSQRQEVHPQRYTSAKGAFIAL